MNLQTTKEADCYMHIQFNAFNQIIVLRSSYKARKIKTVSLKLIGIVLFLGLYWYCQFRLLYCIGNGEQSLYCSTVGGLGV